MPLPPPIHILSIGVWGGLVQVFVPYCGILVFGGWLGNGFGFLLTNGFEMFHLFRLWEGFRTVLVGG